MLDSAQEILENICALLRIMTSAMSSNGHVCVQKNTQGNIFWCVLKCSQKNEIVSYLALLALSGLLSSVKCSRHIEKRLVLSSCHVRFYIT